jgi:ribosomal protein S18
MQELKMPLTQIEEIFTTSELAMMAWTSQEQSADLEKTSKKKKSIRQPRRKSPEELLAEDLTGEEIDDIEEIEYERPRTLPNKYYNEDGEVDLSKLTGKEAVSYLAKRGMHFLPIFKTK